MHALVTGGAGFIGSNVVELLLARQHSVTVVDDLSSGCYENIAPYVREQRLRFVQADVQSSDAMREACAGQDVVFHLAASVGRQRSLDRPLLDAGTNVLGTICVLEGMRSQGVRRIVLSSSAAIFGELLSPTITEDHPQNADSPYGVTKLAAEKMVLAYGAIYGIDCICLRYFNIYGVNQRYDLYGNVIPIFAKHIFAGEPLTIYGDGNQTRDFVNVRDVARANLEAALHGNAHGVYNLGSGASVSIAALADMMQDIAGLHVGVRHAPERPADVRHCLADASKALRELDFRAEISLKPGLAEYLGWFREYAI